MATPTHKEKDACDFLDEDHRDVRKLFEEYEALKDSKALSAFARKLELAERICRDLTVHTRIEDEIFYPGLRAAIPDDGLLDEAQVEHASAGDLIAQIEGHDPTHPKFDARVTVLGEYIEHHVREEREEMFPKARKARGLDLVAMRGELAARKEQLLGEAEAAAAAA